jgi:assimilatory nitrate reductase electron transfer subunit
LPGNGSGDGSLRAVVVGLGMAGGRLVDELLARAQDGRAARPVAVTVVGAEPYGPYNRVLLSDVVAGRADVAALALSDPAALADQGVDVRIGQHATGIELPTDPAAAGTLVTSAGDRLPFDRLVLATGSAPVVPALDGLAAEHPPAGVHVLRTVDDAREIVAAAANARTAVVLGGGLLGLEAAPGLARRGLAVTVLHIAGHLLEGRLDATAGAVLDRALRRLGVPTRTRVAAAGVETRTWPDGVRRLTGVRLADGEVVAADVLVLACGVRPRTALAAGAGVAGRRGVVVDDRLTTSDLRLLAIGDCAEHAGQVPGLVEPAWEQAAVVADLLTGADPRARYPGHRPSVRLKAADIEVAAVESTATETRSGPVVAAGWRDEHRLAIGRSGPDRRAVQRTPGAGRLRARHPGLGRPAGAGPAPARRRGPATGVGRARGQRRRAEAGAAGRRRAARR